MKKLSFLIALLLLAGRSFGIGVWIPPAPTVNATYNFADFTGSPQAVKRVQITPIQPIGLVGTNIVFPTTITRQTSTAGALTVSNLYNGFSYRVILQDANGGSIGQLTNWFGTNVTGDVNASAYTVISTNLYYGAIAYSQAASDARFSLILSPGTNITFTTNGASIAINAAGSSTIAATNVTGLGTAAYSNASAFYLASNPSAYVTASITNGLGSAAYSNASAFASSGVTNLTAGQLATLASALTNVAFTNIWVTNGINAGSDSTGTYVRGGDGQPLNLSSGGIAYGYAYGGKGGTVNIAMGGYITNGGSGTSGPGDAGTVNIANGVYTAFLGGQAGLAGTVNIANGASGSGATGSAGTVNIATNNGNTYVGRLSAFGVISGNGSGLTNIASTNITGLGTAAYSNSTAFAPSTVTNLTAGQIATIAAALTNASAFAPSTVTNLTAGQLATLATAITNGASPTFTGIIVTNSGGTLFQVEPTFAAGAGRNYVKSFLGINQTSPNWALDVNGTIGSGVIGDITVAKGISSVANNSFYFDGGVSANSYVQRSGGNFGIGKTNPATALDVSGTGTFTGLSVGAQTALDVNGNGKVGGVGLTNGVLTGNGSGLTNVYYTNLTVSKIPVIWGGPLNFNFFDYASGNMIVAPTYGATTIGLLSYSMASFGNSTGSKLVTAYALTATNSGALNINFGTYFTSNNVGVRIDVNGVSVTPPAINTVFYYYQTNTIGNITNLQAFSFGPYNNGATLSFKLVVGSCYGFLIP